MKKLYNIFFIILFTATLFAQIYSPESHLMVYDNLVKGDSVYEYGAPKLIGGLEFLQYRLIHNRYNKLFNQIRGTVLVKVLIDTNGLPTCEVVIKGLPYGCNEEALKVVKKIRFSPAIQHKRKVVLNVVVAIAFNLNH